MGEEEGEKRSRGEERDALIYSPNSFICLIVRVPGIFVKLELGILL